jgi:hypothetical protein
VPSQYGLNGMKLALFLLVPLAALAQDYDVQRALIMRDQQSAQFAARLRGAPLAEQQQLESLSAQRLLKVAKDLPQELRAYERQQAAQAHILALPPPVARASAASKLRPLPVTMPGAVDVVPVIDIEPAAGTLPYLTRNR